MVTRPFVRALVAPHSMFFTLAAGSSSIGLDAPDYHDPRQLLGPCSPLSVRLAYALLTRSRWTARRQAHRWFVQALRHSAATREQVDAAVTTFVSCFGRLWRVPWENGYKEVFRRLAVNGLRAAGACQRFFSAPCPCDVVGSGAHGDGERLRQHALLKLSVLRCSAGWGVLCSAVAPVAG
jgi:hypothetical protein